MRLNVTSFNCYDICARKYNDIVNNPFPSYKSLMERSRFFATALTEIWEGEKSQYDSYMELNTFSTYSYIHEILLMFKRLYLIHGLEKWKHGSRKHCKLNTTMPWAMRDVLGVMQQKTAFAYHVQLYQDLSMEACSDDDDDNDSDSDYYSEYLIYSIYL